MQRAKPAEAGSRSTRDTSRSVSAGWFLWWLLVFNPRHIGPADAADLCDLPLGTGRLPVEAVAHADDERLPLAEHGAHLLAEIAADLLAADPVQHVVLFGDDVHEREAVALPVHIDGVGEAQVPGSLFEAPEIHQNLIFNAF